MSLECLAHAVSDLHVDHLGMQLHKPHCSHCSLVPQTCLCACAVADGVQSQLLGEIHIALLRLLQMDLEEAHATGAIQARLYSC